MNRILTTTALAAIATAPQAYDNQQEELRGYANSSLYQYTTDENVSGLMGVYEEVDETKASQRQAQIGAFNVTGRASAKVTFNDNIYASANNEEGDTILTIAPFVAAQSAWSRHSLGASAYIKDNRYNDNSSEDHTDFGGRVTGQLDVKRGTYVVGNLMAERRHEERGEPNAVNGTEPTQYARRGGEVRVVHAPGRVSLVGSIGVEARTYEDGETTTGATINNSDRDRMATTTSLRAGYEVKPGYEAFTKVSYVNTAYDEVDTAIGAKRSSDGYDAIVGMSAALTGKLQGEVYTGISERSYDAATLGDITEPVIGGNLLYRPSDLTSVKVGLKRGIEETTLSTASGFVQTALTGRVEHAIRRNVLIGANATLAQNAYEGGTSNREDDIRQAGIDARYDFGNDVSASVGYEWTERDSNQTDADYTRGRFMTRLMGKF